MNLNREAKNVHDWLRAGSWYQIVSISEHFAQRLRREIFLFTYRILQGPRTETLPALAPNRSDQLKAKTCTSQGKHTKQIRRKASQCPRQTLVSSRAQNKEKPDIKDLCTCIYINPQNTN